MWKWLFLFLTCHAVACEPEPKCRAVEIVSSDLGMFQGMDKVLLMRIAFQSENEIAFSTTCKELRWRIMAKIDESGPTNKQLMMALPQNRELWCHWGEEGHPPHPLAKWVVQLDLRQCITPERFDSVAASKTLTTQEMLRAELQHHMDAIGLTHQFKNLFFPKVTIVFSAAARCEGLRYGIFKSASIELSRLANQHYLAPHMLKAVWRIMYSKDIVCDSADAEKMDEVFFRRLSPAPNFLRLDAPNKIEFLRWLGRRVKRCQQSGETINIHEASAPCAIYKRPKIRKMFEFLDDKYPGVIDNYHLMSRVYLDTLYLWKQLDESVIMRILHAFVSFLHPVSLYEYPNSTIFLMGPDHRRKQTEEEIMIEIDNNHYHINLNRNNILYCFLTSLNKDIDVLCIERLFQMMSFEDYKAAIKNLEHTLECLTHIFQYNLIALKYFDHLAPEKFAIFVRYLRQNNKIAELWTLTREARMKAEDYIAHVLKQANDVGE